MSKLWTRTDFWPAEPAASISREDNTFARGVEEGQRVTAAEFAADREALRQLANGLDALKTPSVGTLAALIVAAVERLVTEIAGNAAIDPELLSERADALAALVADETAVVLVLHPDDAALIDEGRFATRIFRDVSLPRGTVQARVGNATYEDGVAAALARLCHEIERTGLAT